MSLDHHFVRRVEHSTIQSRYPRTIGRNARLGSHGNGGVDDVVILHTDTGKTGWGLAAGLIPEDVVGRSVGELIDPATGKPTNADAMKLWSVDYEPGWEVKG